MKLNDWANREDYQLEWKKLWESNDALKAGFCVLREIALPQENRPPTGLDYIQHNALLNARREGYYDALRNIEALKEIKKPTNQLPEPWSSTQKED